jgi:hypothetical protein
MAEPKKSRKNEPLPPSSIRVALLAGDYGLARREALALPPDASPEAKADAEVALRAGTLDRAHLLVALAVGSVLVVVYGLVLGHGF